MFNEFEVALCELNESFLRYEIDFHLECAEFLSESALNEGVINEAAADKLRGMKEAIRNMVYSFFDFVGGALTTLCNKLQSIPELARNGVDLKKKGAEAKEKVGAYWKEVKATTGEDHGEGRLNAIKNKISNIIAKFQKLCNDVKEKMRKFINKTKMTGADAAAARHGKAYVNARERSMDNKFKKVNDRVAKYERNRHNDALNRYKRYSDDM